MWFKGIQFFHTWKRFLQNVDNSRKKSSTPSDSLSKGTPAADPSSLIQAKPDAFDGLDPLSMFAAQEASTKKTSSVSAPASKKEQVCTHCVYFMFYCNKFVQIKFFFVGSFYHKIKSEGDDFRPAKWLTNSFITFLFPQSSSVSNKEKSQSDFKPWLKKRVGILAKYTTSQKLSISTVS